MEGEPRRCLAFPPLVGVPVSGDRVLLNTTALEQRLGTGGYALVIAIVDWPPPDDDQPGHREGAVHAVAGVGTELTRRNRPFTTSFATPTPWGICQSSLPTCTRLCPPSSRRSRRIGLHRVAYVMTDGGALPLWFSRTVAALRHEDLLVGSVTVGQAFGGDAEAVTLHTGLLAARLVLHADVAVVAQGPATSAPGRAGIPGVAAGKRSMRS